MSLDRRSFLAAITVVGASLAGCAADDGERPIPEPSTEETPETEALFRPRIESWSETEGPDGGLILEVELTNINNAAVTGTLRASVEMGDSTERYDNTFELPGDDTDTVEAPLPIAFERFDEVTGLRLTVTEFEAQ